MRFSKIEIIKMKEADFQSKVLIPLFRAMQFRDVTSFGGGSLEKGKDIVMWKNSDFGQRVNTGVVVKAKKITGNAETNSGAMNVLNQVRQMLKTSYINPVNGDRERIKRCIVACSKEITKEAMNSIEGELENDLDKVVEWIHPETNLFDLIDEYLPEVSMWEKLSSIKKDLDESMKLVPYRIVADTDNKISFYPKHENATKEFPFNIEGSLKFSDTPKAKNTIKKLNDHITKGLPVEIEGEFIEFFKLPDFVPDWIQPNIDKNAKLQFEHHRSDFIIPLRMVRTLNTGEEFVLDRIELQIVYPGTEEITLKNDKQNVPYQFEFRHNLKEKRLSFDLTYKFYGYNVSQHLQAVRFLTSLSKDGKTDIYQTDLNLKIVSNDPNKYDFKESLDDWIKTLEALVLIQEKIPIILNLQIDYLDNESVINILDVAEVIRKGKIEKSILPITTIVSLDNAKDIIKRYKDKSIEPIFINYSEGITTNILENEINLGIGVTLIDVYINDEDLNKIKSDIKAKKREIEVSFTPKNSNIIIDLLKFDCEDRHTRFHITDIENAIKIN